MTKKILYFCGMILITLTISGGGGFIIGIIFPKEIAIILEILWGVLCGFCGLILWDYIKTEYL